MRKAAFLLAVVLCLPLLTVVPSAQTPATAPPALPQTLEGATNYHRVDAAFGCGGAVTDQAVAALKQQGFAAVIDFRAPDEPESTVATEREAARNAGLKYINLPFSTKTPDGATIDLFLKSIADPANLPAFIHCRTGNRAAMMWMIKRVILDGWPTDKALQEAQSVGLTQANVRQVGLDYLKAHGK